jgi:pSer/pThr/pTyr-binding forkhead associated (FHA) protein
MGDRSTRRLPLAEGQSGADAFLQHFRAALVVLTGDVAGSEFELASERTVIGRGPGVDLAFDDDAMSRQHAALELGPRGFRIQDLGSTNGIAVNESETQVAELKHGDRFKMGEHSFQLVIEKRERPPRTYTLPDA